MSSSQSSPPQVQEFLNKLDEIRAVFILGRRALPFLEETIQFVQDITVLLEEVNATIQTRTGHMHRAKNQLQSVSEATEVATSEILDHTDEVLSKLEVLKKGMNTSEEQFADLAAADDKLLNLLREELGDDHEELLEEVEQIQRRKQSLREERTAHLEESREVLSGIRNKMNQITMSLQVQDITEQQLASVNHLIETVRDRIDSLLEDIGTGKVGEEDMPSGTPSSTATFNAGARYDRSPDRQRMADDLVDSMRNGASSSSGNGGTTQQSASSARASSAGGHEAATQSDIDEMFEGQETEGEEEGAESAGENGGGGEVASQDDIDELFQQGS